MVPGSCTSVLQQNWCLPPMHHCIDTVDAVREVPGGLYADIATLRSLDGAIRRVSRRVEEPYLRALRQALVRSGMWLVELHLTLAVRSAASPCCWRGRGGQDIAVSHPVSLGTRKHCS